MYPQGCGGSSPLIRTKEIIQIQKRPVDETGLCDVDCDVTALWAYRSGFLARRSRIRCFIAAGRPHFLQNRRVPGGSTRFTVNQAPHSKQRSRLPRPPISSASASPIAPSSVPGVAWVSMVFPVHAVRTRRRPALNHLSSALFTANCRSRTFRDCVMSIPDHSDRSARPWSSIPAPLEHNARPSARMHAARRLNRRQLSAVSAVCTVVAKSDPSPKSGPYFRAMARIRPSSAPLRAMKSRRRGGFAVRVDELMRTTASTCAGARPNLNSIAPSGARVTRIGAGNRIDRVGSILCNCRGPERRNQAAFELRHRLTLRCHPHVRIML